MGLAPSLRDYYRADPDSVRNGFEKPSSAGIMSLLPLRVRGHAVLFNAGLSATSILGSGDPQLVGTPPASLALHINLIGLAAIMLFTLAYAARTQPTSDLKFSSYKKLRKNS